MDGTNKSASDSQHTSTVQNAERMVHSIFGRVTPFSGIVKKRDCCEFTGATYRREFGERYPGALVREEEVSPLENSVTTTYPAPSENAFQWIALLSAVVAAKERFTMMELGCGWGRWMINGAAVARHLEKPFTLVGVEAEPTHFEWLKTALKDNDVSEDQQVLVNAAVAGRPGEGWFTFGKADDWYGQSLLDDQYAQYLRQEKVAGNYDTARDSNLDQDIQICKVSKITLNSLLDRHAHIDFVHMDIQGAEAEVVESSIDRISEKVEMILIGTHSPEVEFRLRKSFASIQWLNVYDFATQGTRTTPYGPVDFVDGIQCWIRPDRDELFNLLTDCCPAKIARIQQFNLVKEYAEAMEKQQSELEDCRNRIERYEQQITEYRDRVEVLESAMKQQAETGESHRTAADRYFHELESIRDTYSGVGPKTARIVRSLKTILTLGRWKKSA